MEIKTCMELLDIIDRQNHMIAELVSKNLEQEALINELMKGWSDKDQAGAR